MSTATKFLFKGRHFPFCPEELDIDAIEADLSVVDPYIGWVRDLTLHDAMQLFWNLESLEIDLAYSGTRFVDTYFGEYSTVGGTLSGTTSPTGKQPRQRVCSFDSATGPIFDATVVGSGNENLDSEYVYLGAPFTNSFTFGFKLRVQNSGYPDLLGDGYAVTKQTDGLYTLWFELTPGGSRGLYYDTDAEDTFLYVTPRTAITGPGQDPYSGLVYTGLYADIPILSGTTRLFLNLNAPGEFDALDTAGSITVFTLTPNFFTY